MALAFIRKAGAEETVEGSRRRAVAARVKILVEPGAWDTRIRSLPAGIRLEPGSLRVEFRDPQELLQKLFVLSQAIAEDFEQFEKIAAVG
jgi:hypothetical protein